MAKCKDGEVVNFTGWASTQYQAKQKVIVVKQYGAEHDLVDVIFPKGSLYQVFGGALIPSVGDTPQTVYANSLKKIRVRKPKEAA